MALETLNGVVSIGGFDVLAERPTCDQGIVNWDLFDKQRKAAPIYIDHKVNMISFRIQDGPIKEVGVNGCQVDTLIHTAKAILEGLNEKFPCLYNDIAIEGLDSAIQGLDARKKNREARGVEGFNKK